MRQLFRLTQIAGLDKAVVITLANRAWTIVAGLGTLVLVTQFLSREVQGYYYTFYSLISLQVFLELGLNFAIIQFVSHEMAKLQWHADGVLTGDALAKRRIKSLTGFAMVWFGIAALLVLLLMLPGGLLFFKLAGSATDGVQPNLAWSLVVVFTAANLIENAALAILEGCNRVAEVAAIRLAQMVASTLGLWIALALDAGLLALAVSSAMAALVGALGIAVRYRRFFIDLWRFDAKLPGMRWRHEVWPFQWRIAVSWASGYLIFQLFTPLLFATHGAVPAGQMGMSLQIINALNSLALVWITTKAPVMGQYVAQNNRDALDLTFSRAFVRSLCILAAGIGVLLGLLLWMQTHLVPYAERVLPLSHFAWLSVVCAANHIVFSEAAYLRAHKVEPFLILSIVTGVTIGIMAVYLIPPFGYTGAVAAYATGTLVIALTGGTIIFLRKRALWNTRRLSSDC